MAADKRERTPWFQPYEKPRRPGLYEAQDRLMRCGCCWLMLEWRGGEWFSFTHEYVGYRTHFFQSQLRRWRGLAKKPRATAPQEPQR